MRGRVCPEPTATNASGHASANVRQGQRPDPRRGRRGDPPHGARRSAGGAGAAPGTEQDLGGLHFDPQGADFTLWIIAFKKEVYRNWVVPQAAQFGNARGHVNFEFTVERNGSMSALRMLQSSGTASLDQAAQNALSAGRFTALPNDYTPPRVTMQVTFFYNEAPDSAATRNRQMELTRPGRCRAAT